MPLIRYRMGVGRRDSSPRLVRTRATQTTDRSRPVPGLAAQDPARSAKPRCLQGDFGPRALGASADMGDCLFGHPDGVGKEAVVR